MTPQISPTDLAGRLRTDHPPRLLDVREAAEHALVALPNSKLIPLGLLPARAAEIGAWQDEEIVVYCHHGIRSLHAIAVLRQLGFRRLLNLSGGIDAWTGDVDPSLPRY